MGGIRQRVGRTLGALWHWLKRKGIIRVGIFSSSSVSRYSYGGVDAECCSIDALRVVVDFFNILRKVERDLDHRRTRSPCVCTTLCLLMRLS